MQEKSTEDNGVGLDVLLLILIWLEANRPFCTRMVQSAIPMSTERPLWSSHILSKILQCESAETHGLLRAFRTLSKADRRAVDGAAKFPAVADHVILRFRRGVLPRAVWKKLQFYIHALKIPVKHLTINGTAYMFPDDLSSNDLSGATVDVREVPELTLSALLRNCPQLQSVNFQGCRSFRDTVAEQMAAKCRHLKRVNFSYCETDSNPSGNYEPGVGWGGS